ncbi:hypothetical protein C8R47DRAFT_1121205 [Mycena vitilis]|nr:hypothetical protein C8R47DRAFT_1121205 [Mycena vitilis]
MPPSESEGARFGSPTVFRSPLISRLTQNVELHKLLRSNEPPTRIQALHCQEIVLSAPGELEQYDAEILRIKTILEEVGRERALLDAYSRLCRYTISPIRRLPAEILTEIFNFFLPEVLDWPNVISSLASYSTARDAREAELGRAANADLLRISQVCPRWHQLVMGTPSLWSRIGLVLWSSLHWRTPALLESSLKRSGNFPLELGVHIPRSCGNAALKLLPVLVQQSRRWREVSFAVDGPSLLSTRSNMIRGNLPLLKTLRLHIDVRVPDEIPAVAELTSFFAVAPRLTEIWYGGRLAALSNFPLEQLDFFRYHNMRSQDVDAFISMISRFSNPKCACRIRIDMNGDPRTNDSLPAVTSQLHDFTICVAGTFRADAVMEMLTKFMARLTLPSLFHLQIEYLRGQKVPLPWPHLEFLALSRRSSFCNHLIVLEIEAVLIAEPDLLQVLSELPSLEHLGVSDHRVVGGEGEELVLVTDSLLQRLTWTSDAASCLVPRLSYLGTHTLLKFDDTVYRKFVLSRITPGRNSLGPFEVELWWYPEYHRELNSEVVAQFMELVTQGEFLFLSAESPHS